jgi:hypothetical protein
MKLGQIDVFKGRGAETAFMLASAMNRRQHRKQRITGNGKFWAELIKPTFLLHRLPLVQISCC